MKFCEFVLWICFLFMSQNGNRAIFVALIRVYTLSFFETTLSLILIAVHCMKMSPESCLEV